MIVGYVLFGVIAGLLIAIFGLLFGASFWLAFVLYGLAGAAAMILLPVVHTAAKLLVVKRLANAPNEFGAAIDNLPPATRAVTQGGAGFSPPMRILAVDDDPFILELIPIISARVGLFEVTSAASSEQALKLIATSDIAFDCFLLDISMSDMDGIELCRIVRQTPQYRQSPIIMLTAMRDITNMGNAYRAGATDYATKPFDLDELGERLKLAKEAIQMQSELASAGRESASHLWNVVPDDNAALPLVGVKGLVKHEVLSSYLTQLPRKEVTKVQVFAILMDGIEAVQNRSSIMQLSRLLEDVAAVTTECLGVNRTLMAYISNSILLVATDTSHPMPTHEMERQLLDSIEQFNVTAGQRVGLTVGGPVDLSTTKTERFKIATARAISLAESRVAHKQGRRVARLYNK